MVTLKINELRCRVEKDEEGSSVFMYHEMCMRLTRRIPQVSEEHFISLRYSTIVERLNQRKQYIQELQETIDYKTNPICALKLTQEKYNTDLALGVVKDLNFKLHRYTLSYTVGFRIPIRKWIYTKYEAFVEIINKFQPKLKFEKEDCLEKHVPMCNECSKYFCDITYTIEKFQHNSMTNDLGNDLEIIGVSKSNTPPEEIIELSPLYFFEY